MWCGDCKLILHEVENVVRRYSVLSVCYTFLWGSGSELQSSALLLVCVPADEAFQSRA